jgi:hypothetical protein
MDDELNYPVDCGERAQHQQGVAQAVMGPGNRFERGGKKEIVQG